MSNLAKRRAAATLGAESAGAPRSMYAKIMELASDSVVFGLGNSAIRVVNFFLLPVYTHFLTPEDYGALALVGMLGQILFILMNMGQSTAVVRTYFAYEREEDQARVITTSLYILVGLSLPVGLVALALSKPLAPVLVESERYWTWLLIGTGGIIFKTALRLPFAVLRARRQSWNYAVASFFRTLAAVVLAVVFVAGLKLGGRGVLMSQLLGELLMCAVLMPITLRGLKLHFAMQDARDLLGYGLYQVPSGLFGFVLNLADRYFLRHYASLYVVGIYSVGYRFGDILYFVIWAFELAWPQFLFGNRRHPDAPFLYARVSTYFFGIMGGVWLVLSLYAEELVSIMARRPFHEAYHVVPWIAASYLCQGLAWVGAVGMQLHRKVKYRPVIMGIAAAFNMGLNFLLIPRWEMMGAAIATFASFVLLFVLQCAASYRLYPVPYEYRRLLHLSAVGAAVYVVGTAIAWGALWAALAGKTCLLLAGPLVLYATGFFEERELTRARAALAGLRRGRRGALEAGR